jgi:hypothetical protein
MFFDVNGNGNQFVLCSGAAKVKPSLADSVLYIKSGNNDLPVPQPLTNTEIPDGPGNILVDKILDYVDKSLTDFEVCRDELPTDYGNVQGTCTDGWTCKDWAGKGNINNRISHCDEDWSKFRYCVPETIGAVSEYCEESCDICENTPSQNIPDPDYPGDQPPEDRNSGYELCTFEVGDQLGGTHKRKGKTDTEDECAEVVKTSEPNANAATWWIDSGRCFAGFRITGIDNSTRFGIDNTRYKTCLFTV